MCVCVTFGETGVLYSKSLVDDRNDWILRSISIIKTVRIRGTARFLLNVLCKTILRLDYTISKIMTPFSYNTISGAPAYA